MTVTKTKVVHPLTGKKLTTDTQGSSYYTYEYGTKERLTLSTDNTRNLYGLAFRVELEDKEYNVVVFTPFDKFSIINPNKSSQYIYEVHSNLATTSVHTSDFDRGMLNGGLSEKEWLNTLGIKGHIHFREGKAKILKYLGWYHTQYARAYNFNGKDTEVIIWYQRNSDGQHLCFSSSIENHIIKPKAKNCVLAKSLHNYGNSYPLQQYQSVKEHKFRKPKKKPVVPYIDLEMIE